MRYRQLSPDGDYKFGDGTLWLVNTPEGVAQAIRTRLKLFEGEWFLDDREGLALDEILGYHTQLTRDQAVQLRILGTEGVLALANYKSTVTNRAFDVQATVDTIYGTITLSEAITL